MSDQEVLKMADETDAGRGSLSNVQERLQEVASLLGDATHLDPAARQALAGLAEEMRSALAATNVPSDEELRLAQHATQLIDALHRQQQSNVVTAARQRLDKAILSTEFRAPVLAGLGRQLLDLLATLGI
jgi:hypothetical protein